MATTHRISADFLSLDDIEQIFTQQKDLILGDSAATKIQRGYEFLQNKIKTGVFYGINTGFGDLKDKIIPADQLSALQNNLLRSHACGIGDEVPADIVRLMLLLKAQSLAYGNSGVSIATVKMLLELYNRRALPIVYEQGSLGASGDLAPLAHLCLPLIGEGEMRLNGETKAVSEILRTLGLAPLTLQPKEGLALINGTQFMSSYGVWSFLAARRLLESAECIAALSMVAWQCKHEPLHPELHRIRNQAGQIQSAARIAQYLEGTVLENSEVQDPYSFRCAPQVHGASRAALRHVGEVLEMEINGVSDNPNIFPDEDAIVSGGNFHGQPLALALDYLAMAAAELANISERRIFLMLSGKRALPPFLAAEGGLHSGLMIVQYSAAAIVSQNKQYCTPASVDSITSSNGQEDHVSMGANAATKCLKVVQNVEKVLAMEWLTAAQALGFRNNTLVPPRLQAALELFRSRVPFMSSDRFLHQDIKNTIHFIRHDLPAFLIKGE